MTSWAEKYLRIPFVDRGDSWSGCDCWGLCRLILKEEADKDLPAYEEIPAGASLEKAQQFLQSRTEECWQRVDSGSEGPLDLVLMKGLVDVDGKKTIAPLHIGCVVKPKQVIHIEYGCDVSVVDYKHPKMQRRIIDFYRYLG